MATEGFTRCGSVETLRQATARLMQFYRQIDSRKCVELLDSRKNRSQDDSVEVNIMASEHLPPADAEDPTKFADTSHLEAAV
jgi:hypothetical protein